MEVQQIEMETVQVPNSGEEPAKSESISHESDKPSKTRDTRGI